MSEGRFSLPMAIAIIFCAVIIMSFAGPMYAEAGINPMVLFLLFFGLVIYVVRHTRSPENPGSRRGPPPAI